MSWTDQCPAQATGIDLKLGFSACQSHMTAMMAMPPVVPVNHRPLRAVTPVIAMIDAEDAFHAADDAADCCANHRADRASDAVALIEAMRSAAGNALCLCGERHRKRYEKQAGNKQVLFHEVIPFEVRGFRRHDGARNWHPYEAFRWRRSASGSGCVKTLTFNLRVEIPSRFCRCENQLHFPVLSREGN